MECLKKSGRIASQCTMDAVVQVQLLVELLNTYMFFKEKGNTEVSKIMLLESISNFIPPPID